MAITSIDLSNLNGTNGFRLDGTAAFDLSGTSVSNAGDINGDGFDDLIVGAYGADPSGLHNAGSSYVVFGKAAGFDATLNLSDLNGSNGFRLDGEVENDRSGRSVSSAGDVNGDGFDDLIIGAGGGVGSSYVVFGKASDFSATLTLSNLDGSNGFSLRNAGESDLGHAVSSAGDVNGDGFDDLILGASGEPYGAPEYGVPTTGASFVVFGKASGFNASLDLSSLDGNTGFRMNGLKLGDQLGYSVSSAGDVNGDGFDDVMIATASYYQISPSYVVFGSASGFSATLDLSSIDGNTGFRLVGFTGTGFYASTSASSAGDINGDGFDDVIMGYKYASNNDNFSSGSSYVVFGKDTGFSATLDVSGLDGNNGFRLDGGVYSESGSSVSSAGDVNGDGFDDLMIGASGSSYVVFGKTSGFSATMDLSSLDGNNGLRLNGVAAGDYTGTSVSSAGDVNGDGFDDLMVGAPGADSNDISSGSSYVIFGGSHFGNGDGTVGTPGDDNLEGTLAAEIFAAGDGNDTMTGRGGADVFHAGAGDDDIRVSDLNFQLIEGGSGNDALHLTGKDLNLDLSNLGDKISGIETICLYGNGDNTLSITAEGLINLSDTTNNLAVNGNVGDRIVGLNSGWTDGGVATNGYFHTYTQGEAVLLVGMNVTTDFPVV